MRGMADAFYRLVPPKDRRINVEMVKPNGRRRIDFDFPDEPEANAWIIYARRLIGKSAHPYPPGPKQKDSPLRTSDRITPLA
jgi:hypothetical protein